jgi:hypothetical protein
MDKDLMVEVVAEDDDVLKLALEIGGCSGFRVYRI